MRKSTLNPNANEFKPRFNTQVSPTATPHLITSCVHLSFIFNLLFDQPKPANTPTPPRPQGQPSPSIVVQQPVYGQPVCFPQVYPLTPVSPGVQVRPPLGLDYFWPSLWIIIPRLMKTAAITVSIHDTTVSPYDIFSLNYLNAGHFQNSLSRFSFVYLHLCLKG